MNLLVRTSGALFELGALPYALYTRAPDWAASCARMAASLPIAPGPRVLDLGCGPGITIAAMAHRRPDARYIGLDRASTMLTVARMLLGWERLHPALVRADALQLPLADGSIDAVTGHSFLYLLPDPSAALREAVRVIRPGGTAAFMEPSAAYVSPGRLLRFSREPRFITSVVLWRVMSRAHRRYRPEQLATALQSAGFVGVETTSVLGGLGVLASAVRAGIDVTPT